jgi:carbonic anhydrase
MNSLLSIHAREDIPENYRDTPIEKLFFYHNMNYPFGSYRKAEMLILMCMDHRKMMKVPDNFAYIIRNSGAKIDGVTFAISFAVAVAKINTIAVIGHSNCRMIDVGRYGVDFVQGLIEQGWKRQKANRLFSKMHKVFEIKNVLASIINEAKKLRSQYSKVQIVPMYYKVEDKNLYLVSEDKL